MTADYFDSEALFAFFGAVHAPRIVFQFFAVFEKDRFRYGFHHISGFLRRHICNTPRRSSLSNRERGVHGIRAPN